MDVGHHTANGVVVEDEAATASFFEDVENLLAVAESIEEGCGRAEVLSQTTEEEDVRIDTLKFVHDGANHLHAVAHVDAHGLFNDHTGGMAVLHSTQIVKAVRQGERLRIGQLFVEFLHAAVDIAQHGVYLLDAFTFKAHAEV